MNQQWPLYICGFVRIVEHIYTMRCYDTSGDYRWTKYSTQMGDLQIYKKRGCVWLTWYWFCCDNIFTYDSSRDDFSHG